MSQEQPWSNNPNAPKISHDLYFREKANLAGFLISSILYGTYEVPAYTPTLNPFFWFILGIVVVLFFRCMVALFNPVHRRSKDVKWGLVFHTVAMFSVVTVLNATQLNIESISYIDNRKLPGVLGLLPPGPLGYQWFIHSHALGIIPNFMFFLNNWLADGLLVSSLFDATSALAGI